MASRYYFAAYTDSGCLIGCDHKHPIVIAAVVCAQSMSAGAYVVAVENGFPRELNPKEEQIFQAAMYGFGEERTEVKKGGVILFFPQPVEPGSH